MRYLLNIFHIPAIMVTLMLFSCRGNESVIPQKAMVQIVKEMYLADQYIEHQPVLRAQLDTAQLYEGILNRYGYSFVDYQESVKYYLIEGDALKKIHIKARDELSAEKKRISALIDKNLDYRFAWWGRDSLKKKKDIDELWKEPVLRSLKWLMYPQAKSIRPITDTIPVDFPGNSGWWQRNVDLAQPHSMADSLYPVAIREYLIAKERSEKAAEARKKDKDIKKATEKRVIEKKLDAKKLEKRKPLKAGSSKEIKRSGAPKNKAGEILEPAEVLERKSK